MADTKKYGFFDNIRIPQLRFRWKYIKINFAYRSECPEIIGKLYSDIWRFSISTGNLFFPMLGGFPAKKFELPPRLLNKINKNCNRL